MFKIDLPPESGRWVSSVSMDKCLFCGADAVKIVEWGKGLVTYDYECGTETVPGGCIRDDQCYENEIKLLKDLAQRMGAIIQIAANDSLPHTARSYAQEMVGRPDFKKVMEEKS